MAFARSGLTQGDLAEVSFLQGWVEVSEVLGPGHYVGVPVDRQISMGSSAEGYPVEFTTQDIVSVRKRRPDEMGASLRDIFFPPVPPEERGKPPPEEAFFDLFIPPEPFPSSPEEQRATERYRRERVEPRTVSPTEWRPPRREEARRPVVTKVDPSRWFDLPVLWRKIRTERGNPEFAKVASEYTQTNVYADIPLILIARKAPDQQSKVADFFGVPPREYERMVSDGSWDRAIGSMLADIEKALNEAMPEGLQGFVEFGFDAADNFGLNYFEGGD